MSLLRVSIAATLVLLVAAHPANAQQKGTTNAGKTIYDRDCATCHGPTGKGDGEQATYVTPTPQDFTTGLLDKRSDAFLTAVISKGGLANGLAESMPAFPKLSKSDLQGVVAYLRQLGKGSTGQKAK
ncbi:MAG: c-type cytochrome [Myxococcaceae bacterium]